MYTAVVTRIIGSQQDTTEYPVRNHTAWQELTYNLLPKFPANRISIDPYDTIHVSTQRGVYWIATLHRTEEAQA